MKKLIEEISVDEVSQIMDETMHDLKTIVQKKPFKYKTLANGDKEIYLGKFNTLVKLRNEQYMNLLHTFKGQTVTIGASRTNPPGGSLGEWLMKHITKTAIASYIVPILLMDGYASLATERGKIRFN
ncbi:hypothetical protein [Rossellomorea vietnamensis]|uniref:hypothetical protein n=1 Tax=Rossellomorea vietnamensis TaxID=218284 RepID=UPI00077C4EEB|nr:hypothetical protein [Rossellomorea vietnamensis]